MIKKISIIGFVLIIAALFLINEGKANKILKSQKINKCIKVQMTTSGEGDSLKFLVIAVNRCNEVMALGKRLKITRAVNVNVEQGLILNTQGFIIPELEKKVIFMAGKRQPGKRSILNWKIIR